MEVLKKSSKYISTFLFPWLLCIIYCMIRESSLSALFLPSSYNNDCLFYYKLVESAISEGGQKGFFGFNESRAIIGGFAAWSPVITIPWQLWGLVFGWNYMSPLMANLFYFSSSLSFFTWSAELKWKNILLLFLTLALFPSFSIHILNCLPEAVILSLVVVYLGMCIKSDTNNNLRLIVYLYLLGLFLTLMRPYYVLVMIFPSVKLIKKKKALAYALSVLIPSISVAGYLLCSHYFCSPYFRPLYDTSVLRQILSGDIRNGFIALSANTIERSSELLVFIKNAFSYGLTAGTQYVIAIMMIVISVYAYLHGVKHKSVFLFYSVISLSMLLLILLLLGLINEGGRHMFTFSIVGMILLCSSTEDKYMLFINIFIIALLIFFVLRGSIVPTDYDIPIEMEGDREHDEYWRNKFEEMGVNTTSDPGFENTLAWVLYDYNMNDEIIIVDHHELYSVPAGMGISCCSPDYITENIDHLACKYLATSPNAYIDDMCRKRNYKIIGETDKLIVYMLY